MKTASVKTKAKVRPPAKKSKKALTQEDAALLRAMKEITGITVSSEDFLKELRNDRKA